jgi:hypothetical protein
VRYQPSFDIYIFLFVQAGGSSTEENLKNTGFEGNTSPAGPNGKTYYKPQSWERCLIFLF